MKECFRPAHIRWIGLRRAHFAGEDRQAGENPLRRQPDRHRNNNEGGGGAKEGKRKEKGLPSFNNAARKHQQSRRASALGRDWDFDASQPAQAN